MTDVELIVLLSNDAIYLHPDIPSTIVLNIVFLLDFHDPCQRSSASMSDGIHATVVRKSA